MSENKTRYTLFLVAKSNELSVNSQEQAIVQQIEEGFLLIAAI